MKIINAEGTWLRSNAQFPLFDQEANHLFLPNQVVKIRRSDWAKAQSVIELVPDPLATPPIIAAATVVKAPVAAPAAKKLSPI